jgi:hypothetical protein
VAEAVVSRPFPLVDEDVSGGREAFEPPLGVRVVADVRVAIFYGLAIGRIDHLATGVLLDAENAIERLGHMSPTLVLDFE